MRGAALLLLLAGCYAEADYVPARTAAFCTWALECTDAATLAFDGTTMESCQAQWGPVFQTEGATCRKFKRKIAKQCVAAIEQATCPADGSPVAEAMPEICSYVYERCTANSEPDDTGT